MAVKYPLVLNGNQIQEIQVGDTINLFPTSLPITLRSGNTLPIVLTDGSYIPVTKRDGTIINITAQS